METRSTAVRINVISNDVQYLLSRWHCHCGNLLAFQHSNSHLEYQILTNHDPIRALREADNLALQLRQMISNRPAPDAPVRGHVAQARAAALAVELGDWFPGGEDSMVGEGRLTLDLALSVQVDGADRELVGLPSEVGVGFHLRFSVWWSEEG